MEDSMTKDKSYLWSKEYLQAYVEESILMAEKRDPAYKARRDAERAQRARDKKFEDDVWFLPYIQGLPRDPDVLFSLSVGG